MDILHISPSVLATIQPLAPPLLRMQTVGVTIITTPVFEAEKKSYVNQQQVPQLPWCHGLLKSNTLLGCSSATMNLASTDYFSQPLAPYLSPQVHHLPDTSSVKLPR